MEYSELVLEHFANPRNVGVIDNADGKGQVGNPRCGDLMEMFIKVENDIITDIKFRTLGCGAAIAVSSIVTELAKGKHLDEAVVLTSKEIASELGGLPPVKMHCSVLGMQALQKAIEDYKSKR